MKRGRERKGATIKAQAITQITLLVVATFAFAFFLQVPSVSAQETKSLKLDPDKSYEVDFSGNVFYRDASGKKITVGTIPDVAGGPRISASAQELIEKGFVRSPPQQTPVASTDRPPSTASIPTPAKAKAGPPIELANLDAEKNYIVDKTTGYAYTTLADFNKKVNPVSVIDPRDIGASTNIFGSELFGTKGEDIGLFSGDLESINKNKLYSVDPSGAIFDGTKKLDGTVDIRSIDLTERTFISGGDLNAVKAIKPSAATLAAPDAPDADVPTPKDKKKEPGFFSKLFTEDTAADLGEAIVHAVAIVGFIQLVGGILDKDGEYEDERNALSIAFIAGRLTHGLLKSGKWGQGHFRGAEEGKGFFSKFTRATGTGVIVGLIAGYFFYKDQAEDDKPEFLEFKCLPFQAPNGGDSCERCNEDPDKPCSEYRCKALGQGCGIINAGTEEEKCFWINRLDATSPGIKPSKPALTPGHDYTDVKERPPGGEGPSGMRVVRTGGGCINAFQPIQFGIEASEPAQCKIDFTHTEKLDDMGYFVGDNNLYVTNHTQAVSLPGTNILNSLFPEVENDGEYELFIRCKDANGNENRDEFSVRFCIDKGPDLTAPQIKDTSVINGAPVQFGVDNLTLNAFVSEPAQCRWSRLDASYENMENQMSCSNSVFEINAELLYTCTTQLTAIEDRMDNDFYFRCVDLSNNTMQQSFKFTLQGTQPLDILKVEPNETIRGSTNTIPVSLHVETDNGHSNGVAFCSYSTSNVEGTFIEFFETDANMHNQLLDLTTGSYKYFIRCVDLGGNVANESTQFAVEVDNNPPIVVRAYNENDRLRVIIDEDGSCKYSTQTCNFDFEAGISMPFDDTKDHFTEWKSDTTYYVKCADAFGNEPSPSDCSIIVRPFMLVS